MEWMETRQHHRRGPRSLWPEAHSVIALGMSYAPAADPLALAAHPNRARISAYAQGADYHEIAGWGHDLPLGVIPLLHGFILPFVERMEAGR